MLELRRGRVLVVEHRERKTLFDRVGCGVARRVHGRLFEDPVFCRELVSALESLDEGASE